MSSEPAHSRPRGPDRQFPENQAYREESGTRDKKKPTDGYVRMDDKEYEIVIDAAEVIRLIVKEVFEERQFHIRHDGQIVETTDPPTVDTQ